MTISIVSGSHTAKQTDIHNLLAERRGSPGYTGSFNHHHIFLVKLTAYFDNKSGVTQFRKRMVMESHSSSNYIISCTPWLPSAHYSSITQPPPLLHCLPCCPQPPCITSLFWLLNTAQQFSTQGSTQYSVI